MSTEQSARVDLQQAANDGDTSPSIVKTALAKKTPPAESPEAITNRRWILFSFWAVALFIGLPLWVLTTTVPRASLPLTSMNQWANGQVRDSSVCYDHH